MRVLSVESIKLFCSLYVRLNRRQDKAVNFHSGLYIFICFDALLEIVSQSFNSKMRQIMFNVVCVLQPALERFLTALEKRVKSARDWLSELLETLMYFKFNWANIKYINKRAWRDSESEHKRKPHTAGGSLFLRHRPLFIYTPTPPRGGSSFCSVCICVRCGSWI